MNSIAIKSQFPVCSQRGARMSTTGRFRHQNRRPQITIDGIPIAYFYTQCICLVSATRTSDLKGHM